MSLLGKFEKRTYTGGAMTTPWGPPYYAIPTNGQAALIDAGIGLTPDQAMHHWAVYACVRLISDMVAAFPADAYVGDVGMHLGEATRVTPKPAILSRPSVYLSFVQWVHQVMTSILLAGNAYGLISTTDRLGYPTQIELLDPRQVTVGRSDGSYVNATTGRQIPEGTKTFRVRNQTLGPEQVWHCPGPMMPGELAGMSPIKMAARTIGMGIDAESFGMDFFKNGIHPTAVATTDQPVNEDQANAIKSRIKNATASRDVPVLGAGLKLEPWVVTPQDAVLHETIRLNAVMVAQIFGVPSEMIGASTRGASITYANREQRAQDFLNNTINPWLVRLEDSFSTFFPRTTFVKFDTKSLLKSDFLARAQAYQTLIGCGVMLPGEAREFEDWPPLPGASEPTETPIEDDSADVLPMRPATMTS